MSVELTTAKSRVGTRQYSDFGPGSSFVATYNQNNCSTRTKKRLAEAQRTDSSEDKPARLDSAALASTPSPLEGRLNLTFFQLLFTAYPQFL